MASQEDTPEGDAKAKLLAEAFQKEGLDAGYWLPKVSQILGIKCREALQHLEYKDYFKLECKARHPWEKKALQKLLNITDDKTASKELQKEHLEMAKQRQEVAKQALKDLTEMLSSHSHNKDVLRKKAETLWQAMEIPKEFWPSPKKPLADMLESIHKQLEQQKELSAGRRENIPDTEVLRRASGGLALQGIYRTSRAGDVLATREQLLRVPEGLQLSGPEHGSVLERREFSSSAAESTFTKSMEQLGFSMSVSAKFAFWGINLGLGVDHSRSSQSQETHQSHSEQSYFCTTKFQYIPLASCYFQRHQLHLSDAALRELQDMEQILGVTGKEDNPTFVKLCESFFIRFGSHINQGPLHFGGIFWWKASTEGFQAEQREEVKRQMSEALNNFVGASWGGFGASAAGALDVSSSSSQASVLGRSGESSHTAIQLYVINTGGPADTTSLPQWKMGLVSDNTTWCVIDRGFELIPVWDVILCSHCGDFKSVGQMSRALRDAYKALTNESVGTIFGEELGSAVQEARDFMDTVKTWEVMADERKLLMLMELKDDLNAKTRNHSVWINVCLSHKALQDFLVSNVRSCQKSPPENTTSIKVMLRILLDPYIYSVKDFPEASFIMQWISQTEHPLPRSPEISELEELIRTLRQMKEHIYAVTYTPGSSASAIHEAKIKATLTSSLAIYSLLQSLQERTEKDMELLVLLIAISTGYQVESSTFQHLLGHPEIQYMAKEMQEAHEEYVNLKEQDADRAEASLLLMGLTVTPESQKLSPEQKRERLVFMEDHMKGLWSIRIKNLLQKHSAGTDWERLEQDLNSLISGCLDEKCDEQRMQNILTDLEDTFATFEAPSESQSKSDSSQSKANEAIASQEFLHLLKRLGLESHYPRKMGMGDFCTICKVSLQDSQPSQDQELPFYFLQKLLTVDYQVRYLTVWEENNPGFARIPEYGKQKGQHSDSFENFLDNLMGAAPECGSSDGHVHPMDLQMAIFHCADDFLRQTLATKLAFCQLALPLLLPNPGTSHIEFPLYALSQIQRSWKETQKSGTQTQTKSYNNKLIFQAQTPIVSFIRIGSSASSSKSQLLNALLSKRKHDTFFHRHCRGSTRERLLMEGVVEIAWYCPRGSPDDTFESCVAFCNLHGDARDHGAQLQFLQDISAVNVALVSELDNRGKKLLQDLWQSQKPLICLLTEKEDSATGQSSKSITIGIKNRNEAELMDQLTKMIRDLLEGSNPCFSLDTCADKARQHGFVVDADQPACVRAKAMANEPVDFLTKEKLSEIKPQLKELKETELQKEQRELDARKFKYEDELLRRSRELAVTLKGKFLNERQLKSYFTLVWNCWIAEVTCATGPTKWVDIDAETEDVLLEHFKEPGFHARITSFPKGRGFSFDMGKHTIKKRLFGYIPDLRSICDADVMKFQHITDDIIARVKANIDKKEQDKQDYSRNFIHEILNEVQRGVNSLPSHAKCTFNREYSIDLSLYLCKMAAERFKAIHKAFQKANDPVMYLSSKREDFFQCFLISCQGATSITSFAVFLCDKIEPCLQQAVFERTAKDIAEDMKRKFPDFSGNRANLEVCILRYLAEQENFEYFKQYLTSPKQFFQSYIERRVKSHCLDESRRLRMFLDSSLSVLYRNILSAFYLSTQIVRDRKDRQDKISLWLDEFCRELAEVINLPRSELKGIEHQEVTDIDFLSSAMAEALYDLRNRLMKELADADMSSFARKPHTILAEHFSGCWEQCPFCGAVCANTIQNHDGDHRPVFHRPQALTGLTCRTYLSPNMENPQSLVIYTCSSLIKSDALFRAHGSPLTPYKTYRDAGPPVSNWNILPDSSMQAYWKWFVSHFRTQLEAFYNGKFQGKGEIPEAWQRITKQEALSELDRL